MNATFINSGSTIYISLPSFLQVIELDEVTCSISLFAPDGTEGGFLYFSEGKLIDAEIGSMVGLDAAYLLCGDNEYTFLVAPPVERPVRITKSLAHILMHAAALSDDKQHPKSEMPDKDAPRQVITLQELIDFLDSSSGVTLYILFNRIGKIVVQSGSMMGMAREEHIREEGEINQYVTQVTACAVSLINLSTAEEYRISDFLNVLNGELAVVAFPYHNMVLGLLLDQPATAEIIADFLGIAST